MTETRQDTAMKLTKANLFSDQVKRQIKVTEERIVDLNSKIDQEIENSGDSQLIPDLIATREQLTHLQVSLEIGAKKQREAQAQLDDWDRAALGGRIQLLDRKLVQAVLDVQPEIRNGLASKLEKIQSLIVEIEGLSTASVQVIGVKEHLNAAHSLSIDLSLTSQDFLKRIAGLNWE